VRLQRELSGQEIFPILDISSIEDGLVYEGIFRQRATEEYHKTGKFDKIFLTIFINTIKISIIPFIFLYLTIEDIFTFVFGTKWSVAGEYAEVLIISTFFTFISTPIDKSALIVNNISYILWWHMGRFVSYLGLSILCYYYDLTIFNFLYGLVFINISFYIYDLHKGYNFSKGNEC